MKYLWALLGSLLLSVGATATAVAQASDPELPTAESVLAAAPQVAATTAAHGFYWQLTDPQAIVPGKVLFQSGKHRSSGTRSDAQFFAVSTTGSNDVPEAALRAYKHAAQVMATADPDCRISWTMLAAIGRVETNHGRFAGAELGTDGISRPEIRGPQLNGAGAFAAIADSDNGTLDHDKVWDRAVGQMQFLPSTWRSVARDGDGDGRKNPDDIDDSALGSAVYLCGAGGSLADTAGMSRAAFRYNHSDYYVALVLSFQAGYETGVFAVPSPPPPAETATPTTVRKPSKPSKPSKPRATTAHTPKATQPAAPKPSRPAASPAPKPAPKPTPTPTPTPAPTPAGPKLVQVDGTWNMCGGGLCLGGTAIDLGPMGVGGNRADADFDGDGATKTNAEEFAGLVGKHVTLQVERTGGALVVYVINGHGYRNADGSFARAMAQSATTTP